MSHCATPHPLGSLRNCRLRLFPHTGQSTCRVACATCTPTCSCSSSTTGATCCQHESDQSNARWLGTTRAYFYFCAPQRLSPICRPRAADCGAADARYYGCASSRTCTAWCARGHLAAGSPALATGRSSKQHQGNVNRVEHLGSTRDAQE